MNDFTCAADNAAWQNSAEFKRFQKKQGAQQKRVASKNGLRPEFVCGPKTVFAQGRQFASV